MFKVLFPLSLIVAAQAAPALGADVSAQQSRAAPDDRYSLELNPLPMLLLLNPGSGGLQGEFEARMTPHLSVFADAYHMQVHLDDQRVAELQKDQSTPDGVPSDVATSGVAAGMRYYGNAFSDSWYVGGKFGGGTTHTDWAYADQRYQDDSFAYTLGAEAGYRWLWSSGFLLRLGGGLGATDITSRTVSALTAPSATSSDGGARQNIEGKQPANRPTLAISYDFGLGWVF